GSPANGVAKNASIVAVQVFTRFDNQVDCGGQPPCLLSHASDQMAALDWVFMNALKPAAGVSLAAVNMSLGGLGLNQTGFTSPCDNDPRKASIDRLRNVGVATVISTGNNGLRNAIDDPSCISTAIAVASTTKADAISDFSNMADMVALLAPG